MTARVSIQPIAEAFERVADYWVEGAHLPSIALEDAIDRLYDNERAAGTL